MDAPCKDCKERHDICWKECERYLDYKKEMGEIKEKIREERKCVSMEHKRASRVKAINNSIKNKKNTLLLF